MSGYKRLTPDHDGRLNLWVGIGSDKDGIMIGQAEPRTWTNRIKWWMLCKVFPFWIVSWDNPIPEWAEKAISDYQKEVQ